MTVILSVRRVHQLSQTVTITLCCVATAMKNITDPANPTLLAFTALFAVTAYVATSVNLHYREQQGNEFTDGMSADAYVFTALLVIVGIAFVFYRIFGEQAGPSIFVVAALAGIAMFQVGERESMVFLAALLLFSINAFASVHTPVFVVAALMTPALALQLLCDPFLSTHPEQRVGELPYYFSIAARCLLFTLPAFGIAMLITAHPESGAGLSGAPATRVPDSASPDDWGNVSRLMRVIFVLVGIGGVVLLYRFFAKLAKGDDITRQPVDWMEGDSGIVHDLEVIEDTPLPYGTPREKIVYFYNQMIDQLRKSGLLYRRHFTPQEFGGHLIDKGELRDKAVDAATVHFERAKYSASNISDEECESARKAIQYVVSEAHDKSMQRKIKNSKQPE